MIGFLSGVALCAVGLVLAAYNVEGGGIVVIFGVIRLVLID